MPNVNSHEPGTPSWVDLMTTDLERARTFYSALFGWTYQVGTPETGYYTMAQLKGRNVAGMGQQMPGSNFPNAWSTYFATTSVDDTVKKVRGAGGQVMMEPMDVMEEGRMAVCADAIGAVFGLWQSKKHLGAQVVREPGATVWHELNTRDTTKARDFYGKVLGLEAKKIEGMEYWTLHKGPYDAGGLSGMDSRVPAQVPPHWMVYFAVTDVDATVKTATTQGAKIVTPAFDTPYGRMASLTDPTGAAFMVMKPIPTTGK